MRLSPEAIQRIQEFLENEFNEDLFGDRQIQSDLQCLLEFYLENTKDPLS